jgi:hypothetical protein
VAEDRPALEIEITPEMYEAGSQALANCYGESYDVIIPQVFRAMVGASRCEGREHIR